MQIQINDVKRELKQHGDFTFPVSLNMEMLSRYEGGSFLWHWHSEVELTLILKGSIEYQINSNTYQLRAGDGLFCNSNALHAGQRTEYSDCRYLSITFHPRFLYGYENSILQTKYVNPVLSAAGFSSLPFYRNLEEHKKILEYLDDIYALYCRPSEDMEFRLHLLLSEFWLSLYHCFLGLSGKLDEPGYIERLREILAYIQTHYMRPVTLEDISSHIHLSKSECCRFFKKHMNMTLFDYLLYYRIQQSLPLLLDGNMTVSKAARSCGFSNSCYYSKIFRRYMHCTPKQYRQNTDSAEIPPSEHFGLPS